MLGQASVATTAGTTPTTKPASSRHSSTSSGGLGSTGLAGFGSGSHYVSPTDDAVKRLNLETRNQENAKRGRLQDKIEQQVDAFLATLDKATRSQLSKTQLIKSLEKVNKWSVENKKYLTASKTVPKEWLDLDLDPAEWSEKKPIPTPAPQPAATAAPAPATPATSGSSSSSSVLGINPSSRFPMFSTYAPRQQEVQFQLTGAIYERERAPKAPTQATQRISSRRTVKMKEWLVRRAGRQMDRDSIRKWIAGTAKNQNLLPEDVLKMYARKRRDLSYNELQQLLDMPDSRELSINELLTSYRTEVAVLPSDDEGSSGGSDDDEPHAKPAALYRNTAAPAGATSSRANQLGSGQPRTQHRD